MTESMASLVVPDRGAALSHRPDVELLVVARHIVVRGRKANKEERVCQVEVTHKDDENVLDPMLNA
jgi:hypothetical protein